MEKIELFFSQALTIFGRLTVKALVYIGIIVTGILLSYFCFRSGMVNNTITAIKAIAINFYTVIGHAFWGLMPLTGCLFYLFIKDSLAIYRSDYELTKPKYYLMIKENAPLIGIGGTMEGVAIGITSMDLNAGVDIAYNSLKLAIGNAVYSSLWGIIIVLFINLIVPVVNPRWGDFLEEQGKRLKSIDSKLTDLLRLLGLLKRSRKDKTTKRGDS